MSDKFKVLKHHETISNTFGNTLYFLLNGKKKRLTSLFQGPGVQKNLLVIESHIRDTF